MKKKKVIKVLVAIFFVAVCISQYKEFKAGFIEGFNTYKSNK